MLIALVGTDLCSVATADGGLESVVRQWGEALARHHDVVLIDPCPDANPDRSVTTLEWRRALSRRELRRVLDNLQPDVVQLNNRPLWDVGDHKRIYTFHNFPPQVGLPQDLGWGIELPRDAARLFARLEQHRVSAVSRALGHAIEDFATLNRGSVTTTYPLVAREFFETRHVGGRGILFPNRVMYKKGVETVLDAIQDPRLTAVPVRFLDYTSPFLRSDEGYLRLRQRIEGSTAELVPAHSSRSAMANEYANADVVISVALEPEGLGLVALEAQAVGTPVVTAGPGGLEEITFSPNQHVKPEAPEIADALVATLDQGQPHRDNSALRDHFSADPVLSVLEGALA